MSTSAQFAILFIVFIIINNLNASIDDSQLREDERKKKKGKEKNMMEFI